MKRIVTALWLSLLSLFATQVQAADKPNVVIILSDDQSWTDYSFMGHEAIKTPHLDKLAEQSALFRRGYVPTALCRPALMTIATGHYSHVNLITGNDPAATPENAAHEKKTGKPGKELMIANVDRLPTLPRILGAQGYLSFQCGKWWEGSYKRGGFTHGMTRGYPERGGRHGDDGLKIGREGMKPIHDFIQTAQDQDKPFFLWYAPFLPHTPHNPPKRLMEKYTKANPDTPMTVNRYYAMVDWFDETCGQLLDHLEEKKLADNTLVIYVTDNGWVQSPGSNGYAAKSKRSPNEMGTRTPIMFRWPGKIKPQDRPELCSSIDIVPTILAATGTNVPSSLPSFPGLDLMDELTEGKPIGRDYIFGESFAHDVADVMNPQASLLFRWVIKGHAKLLLTYDGRPGKMKFPPTDAAPQLYDLKKDPHEKENLAAKSPDLVKELTGLIDSWWTVDQRNHSEKAVLQESQSNPKKRKKKSRK